MTTRKKWRISALRPASVVLAASLFAAGCDRGAGPAETAAPASPERSASARPPGRAVFRPHLRFADGRTPVGGVAFVVSAAPPRAVTSSHLVLNLLKASSLAGFDLADAKAGAVEASATGLATAPGGGFEGFDYSKDVAVLDLDRVPAGAAVFGLSAERASAGEEAEVVACPPDGATSEVSIRGTVVYAGPERIEVDVAPEVNARGFAGAPMFSVRTGKVIGVVQNAVGRNGRGLLLGTPAESVRAEVEKAGSAALPLDRWRR